MNSIFWPPGRPKMCEMPAALKYRAMTGAVEAGAVVAAGFLDDGGTAL